MRLCGSHRLDSLSLHFAIRVPIETGAQPEVISFSLISRGGFGGFVDGMLGAASGAAGGPPTTQAEINLHTCSRTWLNGYQTRVSFAVLCARLRELTTIGYVGFWLFYLVGGRLTRL